MARRARPIRTLGAVVLGLGMAGLAGGAAVRVSGRRLRGRTDPELDTLLSVPDDVAHHHLASNDGGTIHVVEHGEGRPLVLLHGVTLQWWVWSAVFRLLEDRYRVLAWDMRGHGGSIAGSDGVTLEAVADDLAVVLEELDLTDAVVVGHSMGGMALARFCADHHDVLRERVGALMFLATSAASMALPGLAGGAVGAANLVAGLMTDGTSMRYGWRDNDLSAVLIRRVFGKRVTSTAIDEVRRMLSEVDPRTAAEAGAAIATHDVRTALRHVDVPTSVVVGTDDHLTPVAHARIVADEVTDAELHVLDEIGHQVMQEDPVALVTLIDELAARSS